MGIIELDRDTAYRGRQLCLVIVALSSFCTDIVARVKTCTLPSVPPQGRIWVYPKGTGGILDLANRPWHLLGPTGLNPNLLWVKVNTTRREIRKLLRKCYPLREEAAISVGEGWALESGWSCVCLRGIGFTWPQIVWK